MSDKSTGKLIYEVPHSDGKDVLYAAGEALANILPFAGPDLFRLVFSSPLERRREKWMEHVSQGLNELSSKNLIDIENLSQNEEFVTLATEVTKAAIAQHEEEKLQVLKNALLNSLLQDLSYDIKHAFIRAAEQLTPRHVQILRWLKPQLPGQVKVIVGHDRIIKELAVSHFDGIEEIAAVFWEDLCQYRFIEKKILDNGRTEHYTFKNWGVMFLDFVDTPDLGDTIES